MVIKAVMTYLRDYKFKAKLAKDFSLMVQIIKGNKDSILKNLNKDIESWGILFD